MKNRNEKTKEPSAYSKNQVRQMNTIDDAYRHVNKSSFHQNFKALLGHYKNKPRPIDRELSYREHFGVESVT